MLTKGKLEDKFLEEVLNKVKEDLDKLPIKYSKFLLSPILGKAKRNKEYICKIEKLIEKKYLYQIDLVHPYVQEDATPSYHINLLGSNEEGIISRRLNLDPSLSEKDAIISPVTLAYLTAGEHKASIGGKFFVGFSDLIFTPIPEDDPLPKILKLEAEKDDQKFASENPSLQVFIGSRTDDGMDYDTFGTPQEITGEAGEFNTYVFTGRLENFPIPFGSNEVSGELANILTVGLWNNHLVKESSLRGPPLLVKSVEFEAPYFPVWPPTSLKAPVGNSVSTADRSTAPAIRSL